MAREEMVLGITFVLLVVCSAAPIGIETVLDDGCTSQTTMVSKELRWRELLIVNLPIWFEVYSFRPAESSLHCPGPCDAQKNTLYKVDLEPHETESNKIKVNFTAHEDRNIKQGIQYPKKEKPIQCVCHQEALLVFEGSSTLVTCKEESEVKKVQESWRAKLNSRKDRMPIIISVAVGFLILAILCILCIVLRLCSASREQPSARKCVRKPTPCRSMQTHISSVENSNTSTSP